MGQTKKPSGHVRRRTHQRGVKMQQVTPEQQLELFKHHIEQARPIELVQRLQSAQSALIKSRAQNSDDTKMNEGKYQIIAERLGDLDYDVTTCLALPQSFLDSHTKSTSDTSHKSLGKLYQSIVTALQVAELNHPEQVASYATQARLLEAELKSLGIKPEQAATDVYPEEDLSNEDTIPETYDFGDIDIESDDAFDARIKVADIATLEALEEEYQGKMKTVLDTDGTIDAEAVVDQRLDAIQERLESSREGGEQAEAEAAWAKLISGQ
jgi:hypothetical protein